MTTQLYLQDTYLFYAEGVILAKGEDERGHFVILNRTPFYPQGGGQPSDQGIMKNDVFEAQVVLVLQMQDEIRHYVEPGEHKILIHSSISCLVNKERRILNSRYHTAAHLLGNVVEEIWPGLKAVKAHAFPKEAYVEFEGDGIIDASYLQEELREAIVSNDTTKIFEMDRVSSEHQFYRLPYPVAEDKKFRVMQIGNRLPVPCGGTHLACIEEVGAVVIRKIKAKQDIVRIAYEVI